MRFNSTNKIKQFNLIYKAGMVKIMSNHNPFIPFLFPLFCREWPNGHLTHAW